MSQDFRKRLRDIEAEAKRKDSAGRDETQKLADEEQAKQQAIKDKVREKHPQLPFESIVSKGQQLAAFLLEADLHSDSEKQALQQPGPRNRPDVQHVLKRAEKWVANKQKKGWTQKRFAHGLKRFLQRERPRPGS